MKKLFFLTLLSLSLSTKAQDWAPFVWGDTAIYSDGYEHYTLLVDSIRVDGNDTFYYNQPFYDYQGTGNCQLNPYAPNWISVIKKTGSDYFLDGDIGIYHLKSLAALGDVWAYASAVNAEVIEITEENILGSPDSVKWITISKTGYNDTIKLSKNHGFVNAHDFQNDLARELELIGFNAIGETNLDARAMFDFEIGDEIATEETGVFSGIRRELLVILDKDSLQNSVEYQIRRCWLEYNRYNWQIVDIGSDTIDTLIVFSSYFLANQLPHTSIVDSDSQAYHINQSIRSNYIAGRTVKEIFINGYLTSPGCFGIITDGLYPYGVKGLGFWYYFDMAGSKDPIYFKKGNETWGTPITCEGLLSGIENVWDDELIKVYPNPSTDILNISLSPKPGGIAFISDITGKLLKEVALSTEVTSVDVSSLSSGIYLLQIENSLDKPVVRKLVIGNR